MLKIRRNYLFALIIAIILGGCAKQVAPPGGPEDKSPPKILNVVPADNSTNVPTDTKISIEFDEPIKADENAITIFPEPSGISQKIHRKSIEIQFAQPLDENTTYSILITPKLADRRGNNIRKPIELAFSTGNKIDTLKIAGYVFDAVSLKPVEGATIFAYTDSLAKNKPLKISYSSAGGKFTIGHLPDKKIWLYSANSPNFATAEKISAPIEPITPSGERKIYIPLIPNDTIPPSVISAVCPDSFTVKLNFSEPIVLDSLVKMAEKIWFDPADSKSVCIRQTDAILGSKSKIKICDSFGNCTDTTIEIPEKCEIDTTPPSIAIKGKKRIHIPPSKKLDITFSEPADAKISAKIEGKAVRFQREYICPNAITLSFDKILPMGESLEVAIDSFCDDFGNCTADTIFYDIEKTRLGIVELKTDWGCGSAKYFLRSGSKKFPLSEKNNEFIADVPPGKYSLFRFCDSDSDDKWTPGSIRKFRYSEIIEFYPDTISVRGGWKTKISW